MPPTTVTTLGGFLPEGPAQCGQVAGAGGAGGGGGRQVEDWFKIWRAGGLSLLSGLGFPLVANISK